MQITCPHCGFEKDISTSAIPAHATTATCPKCEEKFTFRSFDENKEEVKPEPSHTEPVQEELTHEELIEKAHSAYKEQMNYTDANIGEEDAQKVEYRQIYVEVPWESQNPSISMFSKFLETIKRILFSAPQFFATMPRPYLVSRAIIFYIIIGVIEFISRIFFIRATLDGADDLLASTMAAITTPDVLIIGLAIAPAILVMRLFLYSGILFLVLRVVDSQSADFYLILRMLAYASAPTILSIIPAIGDLVALPWIIFNVFIFCKFGLGVSFTRGEGSVAAKVGFCIIALFVSMIAMIVFASTLLSAIVLSSGL